jgi:hypothetical protein
MTFPTRFALDQEEIADRLLPFFGLIQKRFEARFQKKIRHLATYGGTTCRLER